MNDCDIYMNLPEGGSPEELAVYLDAACGGDAELRARVEALIGAGDRARSGFMATGVLGGAAGEAEPVIEREGSVVGKYKLLQAIGEGGFGVVYMAEQQRPVKRRVAFKLIKPGMDSKQVVARFEAERQALALMDHPNIAKVHDAGETASGRPYFVMELVKGVPITEFCDGHKLDTGERLELFIDVCRAVQHAHQKGVIHRDLKPSNVMVTLHDDKAVVKVIDFGVAKATQTELTDKTLFTKFEQFIGTPAYMSPEQAQLSGLDIDTRSDIYALGVLLYELLTGRTPFDQKVLLSAGFDEMRRVIREDDPPKPSTRMSTLVEAELTDLAKRRKSEPKKLSARMRGDLDWIVMKALEKDRTRRYETANALAMDVGRHLADEPVEAGPPGISYRVGKLVRRHRGAVFTAAAMAALLVAGAAVSTWQAFRATASGVEARKNEELAQLKGIEAANALSERNSTLVHSHFSAANQRLDSGSPDESLAYLASAMRIDRDYWPGAFQAVQILSDHSFQHHPPISIKDDPQIKWVSASPTEDVIATESAESKGILWDASSGEQIKALADAKKIHGIQFSPDGSFIFAALPEGGGDIVGFNAKTGQRLTPPFDVDGNPEHWFRIGPDDRSGPQILLEHGDGSMQVVRWSGERWVAARRLNAGGRLASQLAKSRAQHPSGLDARSDVYYLEPEGTHFVESRREPEKGGQGGEERPVFGFSPDGTMVYGQFSDGVTGVWEAASGDEVVPPIHHGYDCEAIRISPDSRRIVIIPTGRNLVLWHDLDNHDGKLTAKEIDFSVVKFGFDESGAKLVLSGWSGDVKLEDGCFRTIVVDLGSGEEISQIEERDFSRCWSLPVSFAGGRTDDWSNDDLLVSPWLVGAAVDGRRRLKVWDLESGSIVSEITTGSSPIALFTLLRDGRRVLTQHEDFSIRIWDLHSGVPLSEPMKHGWQPYVAVLGSDQTRLMTYDPALRKIYQWDALRGGLLVQSSDHRQKGNLREHLSLGGSGELMCVSRQGSGNLNTATEVGIWKSSAVGVAMRDSSIATEAPVNHAVFSPDGKLLLGCISTGPDRSGCVRIWDSQSLEVVKEIRHEAGVVYAEFSPVEDKVVSVCLDGGVRLWDTETGGLIHEFWQEPILPNSGHALDDPGNPLRGYMLHKQGQARAHFSSDGATVLMHSVRGDLVTWDVSSGEIHTEHQPSYRGGYGLSNAAFSRDGKRFTFCSFRNVQVIDTFTGEVIISHDLDLLGEDARFSLDGERLFVSQWPGTARQFDAATGEEIGVFRTRRGIPSEGFTHFMVHPDPGRPLVANQTNWGDGSTAGIVYIWNYLNGELVTKPLMMGGQSEDHLLDFSQDGLLIGGATKNGEIAVWEIASGERVIHRSAMGEHAFSADFDRDSTRLAVAGERGVRVVHLPPVGDPAPAWLPDLAEAVAGMKLDQEGRIEPVAASALAEARSAIGRDNSESPYLDWAKWYLMDSGRKSISPHSSLAARDMALELSRSNRMDDQFRALQMDPENGRIYARICYLWSADPRRPRTPQAKRLWDAMADYAGRKAIELAPESPEVWALRAAAFEAVGNDESAEVALERALVIGPENPVAWYVQARLRGQDGDREAAYSAFVHSTGLIPGGSPGAAAEAEPFLPGVLGELRAFGSQGSTARAMALVGRAKIAEGRMMEARWLSDRAVELSQDENPVVWRTRLELDPLTENFERVVLAFSPRPFGGREPGRRELADLDELIDYVQRAGYTQEALKMARAMVGLMCENNPRTTSTRLAMRKLAGRALGSDDWGTAGDVLEVLISDAGEDIETTRDWMMLAACYLWQGKDDEYEALARRMVEHHSGAGDAASLERSAKVFFIAPSQSGPALAAKAANMARKANGIATGAWEWMRLCQGIAEYRVGNREEAQQLLSSASNTTQRNCLALASTFLAMAAQGSGDAIGAEVYLRKAEGIIDSSKISENGDATRDWHDLVFAKVALAEAKQLIREEATLPSE